MKDDKKGNPLRGLLAFGIMVALVVALLMALNWVPTAIETGLAREYGSIEEATRTLGLKEIPVPSYFPGHISWPPSFILGQSTPFEALMMEFTSADTGDTVLVILRASGRLPEGFERITMSEVAEESEHVWEEKRAILQTGTCTTGETCSRLSWEEQGVRVSVLGLLSPVELIRIAESIPG
jgi:hypothetical protein